MQSRVAVGATMLGAGLLVAVSSASFRRWSPATLVPLAFGLSAVLFMAEWALLSLAPTVVARVLYLHVSGLGPILASAFWPIAGGTFDRAYCQEKSSSEQPAAAPSTSTPSIMMHLEALRWLQHTAENR